MFKTALFLLFLGTQVVVFSQFSGNVLLEYQVGNLPDVKPDNLQTTYNRTNLQYKYKNFKFFSMLEGFKSGYSGKDYIYPSQLGIYFSNEHLDVKVGNFYETIGRGNLLRSFEIPGSILEDKSFRVRNYFFRDILGASAKYSFKKASIKLLHGNTLDNLYPPNKPLEVRRSDQVSAVNLEYKHHKYKYGNAFLLHQNHTISNVYMTNYLSGTLFKKHNFFVEFSNRLGPNLNDNHAIYGGINFSLEKFNGSLEFKDYKSFLLGAGINQPPALIREHTYRVLNRSTHVLQPSNETGVQLELFAEPKAGHTITFNQTINKNNFGKDFYFVETFLEYTTEIQGNKPVKLFLDYALDQLKAEKNRISAGAQFEFPIYQKQKIKLETELQTYSRANTKVFNQVYGISYTPSTKWIISPLVEISNDPFIKADKLTFWKGLNVKYIQNKKLNLQGFVGSRRGGPSCNAGICYEILDFNGVELRVNYKF